MAKHILLIKPDALGDFVLATPALHLLRRHQPDAVITLLVGERAYPLARWCTDVDRVIPTALFSALALTNQIVAEEAAHLHHLIGGSRAGAPSHGTVLRWDADLYGAGALLFRLGVPARKGYSEHCSAGKAQLNRSYDQFYTEAVADARVEHEVIKNARLLGFDPDTQVLALQLDRYETVAAQRKAQALMAALGFSPGFIAVGIGSGQGFKNFNLPKWQETLGALARRCGRKLCLFGAAGDGELARQLAEACGCVSLAGLLEAHEVYSVIKHAALALGPDSFIKHVAAAAGVPTLELSSQSAAGDPEAEFGGVRFSAWGNRSAMLRPPAPLPGCTADRCFGNGPHCILGIDLGSLLEHAEAFLRGQACVS